MAATPSPKLPDLGPLGLPPCWIDATHQKSPDFVGIPLLFRSKNKHFRVTGPINSAQTDSYVPTALYSSPRGVFNQRG